jgi:hypothetical protein
VRRLPGSISRNPARLGDIIGSSQSIDEFPLLLCQWPTLHDDYRRLLSPLRRGHLNGCSRPQVLDDVFSFLNQPSHCFGSNQSLSAQWAKYSYAVLPPNAQPESFSFQCFNKPRSCVHASPF